jgi:hypothetical protein
MNNADATLLTHFVGQGRKQFDPGLLLNGLVCGRVRPEIPAGPVVLSLVLGEVADIPGFLQLQQETRLPQWQRWVGYQGAVSDDTFGYVSERLDPNSGAGRRAISTANSNEARPLKPTKSTVCCA